MQHCYDTLLIGAEVGPTGANLSDKRFFSRITGSEIVDLLQRVGFKYLVIFMKDQTFSYYNSRIAVKAPGLGNRDLLAECVEAAKPYDMKIIAYCQVQYDKWSWDKHPAWRMKDAHGTDINGRLCMNTGYLEQIMALSDEMMSYSIDGFHFNMLDQSFEPPYGCWCQSCKRKFETFALYVIEFET